MLVVVPKSLTLREQLRDVGCASSFELILGVCCSQAQRPTLSTDQQSRCTQWNRNLTEVDWSCPVSAVIRTAYGCSHRARLVEVR